jgi:hypothetical protein
MTKKDIAFKLTKYLVQNGLFAYSIYAGVILGVKGWENIAKFIIIAMFIVGVLIFIGRNSVEVLTSYAEKNTRVVPLWIDGVFDLVIGGVLIYNSWLWLAVMYLFTSMSIRILDSNSKEHVLKVLKS